MRCCCWMVAAATPSERDNSRVTITNEYNALGLQGLLVARWRSIILSEFFATSKEVLCIELLLLLLGSVEVNVCRILLMIPMARSILTRSASLLSFSLEQDNEVL